MHASGRARGETHPFFKPTMEAPAPARHPRLRAALRSSGGFAAERRVEERLRTFYRSHGFDDVVSRVRGGVAESVDRFLDVMDTRMRVQRRPSRVADLCAVLAQILTLVAFLPTLLRIREERSACALPFAYLYIMLGVQILWLVFAAMYRIWTNVAGALLGAVLVGGMIALKVSHDGWGEEACA